MQIKATTNDSINLTHLRLEEAVPELQIEIYRHIRTRQFYIRYLDGRFESVAWPQTGLCPDPAKSSGIDP